MKTRSGFSQLLVSLSTIMLVMPTLLLTGSAPHASAQMGANIYAAADLTPAGGANSPEAAGSGATFESRPGGRTLVRVYLTGALAGRHYLAQIRDGSCTGPVIASLQPVQTDSGGAGQSVSELPGPVEFGRWYVEVNPEGAAAASLCGVVNPALAGPPVAGGPAPGMPSTGAPAQLLYILLGAGAIGLIILVVGYRVRTAQRRRL